MIARASITSLNMRPFASRRRPKIAKLRAKGNLDGLVEALTHVDVVLDRDGKGHDVGAQVRVDAADALGDAAPDTGVVAALTQALSDLDERVRIAAARSLGRLGHDAAVAPLARALATGDDGVRDEALKALVEIGDPHAAIVYALALVERRKVDSLASAERSALKALLNLDADDRAAAAIVEEIVAQARTLGTMPPVALQLFNWIGSPAVDPLIAALADVAVGPAAAVGLGAARDARAVDPLMALLSSSDPRCRHAAAWSLGEIRDPRSVEALLRATNDDNPNVRDEASEALDKLGAVGVIIGVAAVVQRMLPPGYQLTAGDTPAIEQAAPQPRPLPAPRPRRRTRVQRLFARLAEGGQ
jgi:HEAT repeat protein